VICGFWRTGNYWGSQTFGIEPDIITCAKALSAAYVPISAVMVRQPIYEAIARQTDKIGTFGHGFTYSGHPVAAAVAAETLRIYDEEGIGAHVGAVGPHMQRAIRGRFGDHPLVGEVRGVGLIGAIELVRDRESRANFDPSLKVGLRLARQCEQHGVIGRSLPGDVLAFSPPLVISTDEIDDMVDRVGQALDALAAELAAS